MVMKVCIGSACHLKGSYEVLDRLPGVEKLTTRVILSRVKDVKGLRL